MEDKVSVIVPIYNVEPYLERCVDSLLKQTYKNIEILLVDDSSSDKSGVLAQRYSEQFPEICRFIQRKNNGGLSAARNTGIEASVGTWLTFVDSDDWVSEDYVSSMLETGKQERADIVVNCSYYWAYDTGQLIKKDAVPDMKTESAHKEKVARLRFSAWSKLIKAELFIRNNIRFPEDIWRCEDISTIVPLFIMTRNISIIHDPSYYYFQRSTSLSNQNGKMVDVSFYPATVNRMIKLSYHGFERELEFRAVTELLYGMVMIMLRSGRGKEEICRHIDEFERKYPEWRDNPYLNYLEKGKQIFIYFAGRKIIWFLIILLWGWDTRNEICKRVKRPKKGGAERL